MKLFCSAFIFFCLLSCANTHTSLYKEIGGHKKLNEISNRFIQEIGESDEVLPFFAHSNIDRYHEKFVEYLCLASNGPCEYTGDNMVQVHTGMQITEKDFNITVDLLIKAMDKSGIAHTTQNKLLAKLAPLRSDIIYR